MFVVKHQGSAYSTVKIPALSANNYEQCNEIPLCFEYNVENEQRLNFLLKLMQGNVNPTVRHIEFLHTAAHACEKVENCWWLPNSHPIGCFVIV